MDETMSVTRTIAVPGAIVWSAISGYQATVLVREVGDVESEVSWTVEIEMETEARQAATGLLESALSDGIGGLERDLR